jgi:hypothetical protein
MNVGSADGKEVGIVVCKINETLFVDNEEGT